MTDDAFDQGAWERRWARVVHDHPEALTSRAPNATLVDVAGDLPRGVALDAGCGHGTEALWLAGAGWRVDAVDFSATALDYGKAWAATAGEGIAERIAWAEADLGSWTPPAEHYDLVSCLYVHVAGSVVELVRRLAEGVAPGGTLLLVGHRPVDLETGAHTPAAGQVQVSVAEALEALEPSAWSVVAAEERPRAVAGTGVDAVVHAVRRSTLS
jgi:SAM-dependent methyltransferase